MRKESLQEATQRALVEGYKNLKENKYKKVEAKLEDIQMEIYEMIQTARNVDKQDKDTNIKETIYAMKLDYPEIDEKELSNYVKMKADEIYAGDYDEEKIDESKKVEEAKLNFINNVDELPDMCYGLLPSDKSIIIIKKGENGYYETDLGSPENAEEVVNDLNERMGVTPDQRFTMEIRSINNNWEDTKTESKKVEDVDKLNKMYEQGTTDLEKAFETEVRFWLEGLVGENSTDEIGKQAQSVLDDNKKVKNIVDELVNGSDDLWEDIHIRIEELAGIDYRVRANKEKFEGKKVTEGKDVKSIVKQVLNALNKYDEENVSVDEDEETGNISIMFTSSNNSFPIAKDVCNVKDINVSELVKELDDRGIGHCLLS